MPRTEPTELKWEFGRMERGTWVFSILSRTFTQEEWRLLYQFDVTEAINRLLAAIPRVPSGIPMGWPPEDQGSDAQKEDRSGS